MAAEPWKLLVRAWAEDAERRCARAHGLLTYAKARLAPPLHVADAQDGRTRAQLVGNILTAACTDLASAAASMAAAEIFARYGGATSPATPLPSIGYLPYGHRFLGVLHCAKVCAEDACDSAARCCGRLRTAYHLLGHPGLPGLDGIVDAERVAARGHLAAAQDLAASSAELAATAAPLVL